MVVRLPSWPVFIACSMSSASAPRTSPMMMRSGPHAQRVDDQVALLDRALALDVRRARLEPDDVPLPQHQLGGVLDGDDALALGDEAGQHVQQRRLAGAGAAADDDVQRGWRPPRSGSRASAGSALADRRGRCAPSRSVRKRRIDSTGPSSASGGMIALTREPSGRRASTIGLDSSMRRPTAADDALDDLHQVLVVAEDRRCIPRSGRRARRRPG